MRDEILLGDPSFYLGEIKNDGLSRTFIERDLVDLFAVLKHMIGSVHVGPCVALEQDARFIGSFLQCPRPSYMRLLLDLVLVDHHAVVDGERDVVDFHGLFRGDSLFKTIAWKIGQNPEQVRMDRVGDCDGNNKNSLLGAIRRLKPAVLRSSHYREFHKNEVFGTQKSLIFVVLELKIST